MLKEELIVQRRAVKSGDEAQYLQDHYPQALALFFCCAIQPQLYGATLNY